MITIMDSEPHYREAPPTPTGMTGKPARSSEIQPGQPSDTALNGDVHVIQEEPLLTDRANGASRGSTALFGCEFAEPKRTP
jgi:hypothetical protein